MSTPAPPPARFPPAAQGARVFATGLLVWGIASALGAASVSGRFARAGGGVDTAAYLEIFCDAWKGCLLQAVLGALLHALLWRRPALLARPAGLVLLYGVTLLLFAPFDALFRAGWLGLAPLHGAGDFGAALAAAPPLVWFVDVTLASATFGVHAALGIRRLGLARARALALAERDNLRLRLELEQAHMRGLRAQLEPHFLFNALNAISALVRANDGKTALTGIGRLSALLRYALTASTRRWVSLGEELAFIDDYLALQTMRYGARLVVTTEIADAGLLAIACPPLLLQPLVENALRHDLDCHGAPGDIRLCVSGTATALHIAISNPLAASGAPHAPANPGLGLGLPHTAAALQLAFGTAASMTAGRRAGRFVVELCLPLQPC